jgi:hypothetical protein
MKRPADPEFNPYWARYIGLVGAGDITELLRTQIDDTLALLATIPDSRRGFRYAPGKWSVNEVVGHELHHRAVLRERYLKA